ncbi:MAG: energy transducer TonB [Candidatus Oleimicrobiaceae bacterium]
MSAGASHGRTLRADIGRAAVISVALHAFFLVLLLLITVRLEYYSPDFAEVTFVSGERGGSQRIEAASQRLAPPQLVPAPYQPPACPTASEEVVSLPKRRMLERESEELPARTAEKLPLGEPAPEVAPPNTELGGVAQALPAVVRSAEEKVSAPVTTRGEGKEGPTPTARQGGAAQESFRIEGEAANRQILYKVIPEYPSGLQREAVVRVRFAVLPDGSVGEMVPVLKGDPTLEGITLQALRQWRFNALPPGAPQKEVSGIITFRYLLR